MVCHHFLQLDNGQILPLLIAVGKALVELADSLVHLLKLCRIFLQFLYIVIGDVLVGLEILAEDPLHKRLPDLSPSVIDKSRRFLAAMFSLLY